MSATVEQVLSGDARWVVVRGDCREVMAGLADGCVDHVITDPPYGEHVHSKPWQSHALTNHGQHRPRSQHTGIDFDPLTDSMRTTVCAQASRIVNRWAIAFCDIEGGQSWRDEMAAAGLDYVRTCVWDKVDSSPQFTGDRPASAAELFCVAHQPGRKRWNGGGRRNVFSFAVNAERGGKPHPTTKPIALMVSIIELFTDPDDIILDPFAGSGTTGVAALRLGRRFIGIELDERYHAIAIERLTAEEQGSTLAAARAGQVPMFAAVSVSGTKERRPR